jgi:hypothetical protein
MCDKIIKYGDIVNFNYFTQNNIFESANLKKKMENAIVENTIKRRYLEKYLHNENDKYDNNDFMILLACNNTQKIIDILSQLDKLCDDFKLNLSLFTILLENNRDDDIIKFIENDMIKDMYICLEIACIYNNLKITTHILNNKVAPTKECYKLLVTNNKENESIKDIINLFIKFGYKLDNDDIMLATKYRINLDELNVIKNFVPTEEFYNLCDANFMPQYNDNLYKDIMFIKKICKDANSAKDYTKIKSLIKKNKIDLDDECFKILKKSHIKSKVKDELIAMIK